MVSHKTWALVALALLLAVGAAQAQAKESYGLTTEEATFGPQGAFLMNDIGDAGVTTPIVPALDPLGLSSDTMYWIAEPFAVVDRVGVGSTNVILDNGVDVSAAATVHVALHAYTTENQLVELGYADYNLGVQQVLPNTIDLHVDIDGKVIPARSYLVLQVSIAGTSALDLETDLLDVVTPGPESRVEGFATRILDSDMDGLPNTIEVIIGSNPFNADTDGDGFPDNEEVLNGNDPTDPNNHPDQGPTDQLKDTDGDGLPDEVEAALGTDPTLTDTDGDGWGDGSEVYFGSDPLNADSTPLDRDGDGIPDLADPFPSNPDANDNGVPDGDEDSDGDGITDSEAFKETPAATIDQGVKQTLTNLGSTGSFEIFTALGLATTGLALAAIGLARF
ncbi:MAG: hypothetical protein ACPHK8_04340 [Thermoplasmatota archaeon]